MKILGQITARLLRQHGAQSAIWQPGRPADAPSPTEGAKLPPDVQGTKLGGRHRKAR